MKSLNDLIWTEENFCLDTPSEDCKISTAPLLGSCEDQPNPTIVCGGQEPIGSFCDSPNPPSPTANCSTLDPLKINGCILPMGVSCGGGSVGVLTTIGCVLPSVGGGYC